MRKNYRVCKQVLLITILILASNTAFCKIWQVGVTRTYKAPSAVVNLVSDGDTVQIDAGLYSDCAAWHNSNLLLQGVGNGYAHCENMVCGEKGIWVINAGSNNITIENMEFSGASITGGEGGNGAGLRAQGGSYAIRHCYFHNNQNGILCNPTTGNDSADVLIEYSEFADNGCAPGDASGCSPGYEHNMYIGSGYRSFTIRYSYTHGAIQGHNIKTRANINYILYNRIMDQADGTSSYDIDIAQGGPTIIMGNEIEAGPNKQNKSIICYNEGSTNPGPQNLYLINNTIVNDQSSGYFLFAATKANDTLFMFNNILTGPGVLFNGATGFSIIDSSHNWMPASIPSVGLIDAANYNYQLTSSSPAIDKGTNAGFIANIFPAPHFSLTPIAEYIDTANMQPRDISGGAIDLGAYEFESPTGTSYVSAGNFTVRVLQSPASNKIILQLNTNLNEDATINIYDIMGRPVADKQLHQTNEWVLNTSFMPGGIYIAKTQTASGVCTNRFVVVR